MKNLENKFERIIFNGGYTTATFFDDWLRYIIFGFTQGNEPIDVWIYNQKENAFFHELMKEWIELMGRKVVGTDTFFDALGTLYENVVQSKSKASNTGQFFTPEHICDLMSLCVIDKSVKGKRISDPACGSGRSLLSYHVKNLGNYLYAEDLDRTSCLMTVCNFLIHGCVGEVVWHDSLRPETFYGGWRVNRGLNNPFHKYFGIPHIENITADESEIIQMWKRKKEAIEQQTNVVPVSVSQEIIDVKQVQQLTLF